MQEKIVIVSAKRTAIGNFGGSLSKIKASDLGAAVISAVLEDTKVDPNKISDVIMGQVLSAGTGQNPARQAAVKAGIPFTTPALTINQVCASGLRSVYLAMQAISSGDASIVIAGGQENMSLAPHLLNNSRVGFRMGDVVMQDSMVYDGLTDAYYHYHMGITAENVAKKYGITREMQDEYAAQSQMRAAKASSDSLFVNEIVPIVITPPKGDAITFNKDEFIKAQTTVETLAKLKPAFDKALGSVTPGNSSGANDGAAAVMLMTDKMADSLGLKPLVSIAASVVVGLDPQIMGMGPSRAIDALLKKTGWNLEEVDLIEANEAFAAQAVAVAKELGLDSQKLNVNGGAIALGHPIGASGCRILVTLIHEMIRRDSKKGIATLCVGGGMGIALAVERNFIGE